MSQISCVMSMFSNMPQSSCTKCAVWQAIWPVKRNASQNMVSQESPGGYPRRCLAPSPSWSFRIPAHTFGCPPKKPGFKGSPGWSSLPPGVRPSSSNSNNFRNTTLACSNHGLLSPQIMRPRPASWNFSTSDSKAVWSPSKLLPLMIQATWYRCWRNSCVKSSTVVQILTAKPFWKALELWGFSKHQAIPLGGMHTKPRFWSLQKHHRGPSQSRYHWDFHRCPFARPQSPHRSRHGCRCQPHGTSRTEFKLNSIEHGSDLLGTAGITGYKCPPNKFWVEGTGNYTACYVCQDTI